MTPLPPLLPLPLRYFLGVKLQKQRQALQSQQQVLQLQQQD